MNIQHSKYWNIQIFSIEWTFCHDCLCTVTLQAEFSITNYRYVTSPQEMLQQVILTILFACFRLLHKIAPSWFCYVQTCYKKVSLRQPFVCGMSLYYITVVICLWLSGVIMRAIGWIAGINLKVYLHHAVYKRRYRMQKGFNLPAKGCNWNLNMKEFNKF
jgi:hypothetical protein